MSTIRTAIIGFGTAGRTFHAPLITAAPRFTLSAIVTASPDRVSAAAERYPSTETIATTEELFARADEFDLVVIGSPNDSHAPLALRAIDAGLNVVIDKPIAVTSDDARRVAARATAAGLLLTVFQNRRWDGDFLTVQQAIARGDVGEVFQFESAFEWWKPVLGERWKDTAAPAGGGGILYDLGPHLVDQALQLFGEVVEVHAELDRRRAGSSSDDDSFVTIGHSSGVRTRLWMSAVSPAPRARFRVVGSSGVLTTVGLDPQESQSIAGQQPGSSGFGVHTDGRTATLTTPEGSTALPLETGEHLAFYRLLGDALLDGGPAPVDPADSIRALEIIEQAQLSAR